MAELSADYRGIDYSDAMLAVARGRYPAFCFHQMDARRMNFADDSFDLVAFSYNGIDSVDLAGRLDIIRQVYRVLRPGGWFVFSTLNRQGTAYGETWWDLRDLHAAGLSPHHLVRASGGLILGCLHWFRTRLIARSSADLAIGAISAHNFGLVALFTSLEGELRRLCACGFVVEAIFEPTGVRLAADGSARTDAPWCHFVARKELAAKASISNP
jgi:SAM-dependent methyltransferase